MMSQLGLVWGLDRFIFFKANVFICERAFQGEGVKCCRTVKRTVLFYFVHSI